MTSRDLLGAGPALAASAVDPSAVSAREPVSTPDGPAAIGSHAQAVAVGNALYPSGQLTLDPGTGARVSGDIRVQTDRVQRDLAAVLAASGMTLDDVVQAQVYRTSLDDFPAMNEIYGRHFRTPPAPATVQVAGLPRQALIEISLIAVRAGAHPTNK